MNFEEALQALKGGKKVQCGGWNGKGMWLYFVKESWDTNLIINSGLNIYRH